MKEPETYFFDFEREGYTRKWLDKHTKKCIAGVYFDVLVFERALHCELFA
jgi:hypothetical protein